MNTERNIVCKNTVPPDRWVQVGYPNMIQEQSYNLFENKVLTLLQIIDED
ncbi:TPA: hypothetical protein QCY05_000063 [Bacillus wiedmannii]|nr:hypothetical protein [Bacillus wiedmannii]